MTLRTSSSSRHSPSSRVSMHDCAMLVTGMHVLWQHTYTLDTCAAQCCAWYEGMSASAHPNIPRALACSSLRVRDSMASIGALHQSWGVSMHLAAAAHAYCPVKSLAGSMLPHQHQASRHPASKGLCVRRPCCCTRRPSRTPPSSAWHWQP